MKVLVTGGGGFLGSWVVEALKARGDTPRIFARGDYSFVKGAEHVRGDITNSEAVTAASKGVDAIIHVAGRPGVWGNRASYWVPNVIGTQHVLDACRLHGIPRLVYTSSPSVVFGDEALENVDESAPYPSRYLCHYPESKAEAERRVLAAHRPGKLHTVSLRPHLIWGPGDTNLIPRIVDRARKRRLARVGDGTNLAAVSYVENAAAAHVAALDAIASPSSAAGGRAYFISQAEPVVLWDFIDQILAGVGAPKIQKRVSYATARRVGAALEALWWLAGREQEPPMTRFVAAQLATSHWFQIDRARKDLGWEPSISTQEGLQRLFASYAGGSRPAASPPAMAGV